MLINMFIIDYVLNILLKLKNILFVFLFTICIIYTMNKMTHMSTKLNDVKIQKMFELKLTLVT